MVLASAFRLAFSQSIFGNEYEAFVLMPAKVISSSTVEMVRISRTGRFITFEANEKTKLSEVFGVDWIPGKPLVYDRKLQRILNLPIPSDAGSIEVLGDDRTVVWREHGTTFSSRTFVMDMQEGVPRVGLQAGWRELESESWIALPFLVASNGPGRLAIVSSAGTSRILEFSNSVEVNECFEYKNGQLSIAGSRKGSGQGIPILLKVDINSLQFTIKDMTEEEQDHLHFDSPKPTTSFAIGYGPEVQYISIRESHLATEKLDPKIVSKVKGENRVLPYPRKVPFCLKGNNCYFPESQEFVVYEESGALLWREIRRISLDEAKTYTLKIQKELIESHAEALSMAIDSVAFRNENLLPGQGTWKEKFSKSLEDVSWLDSFNYVFHGGDITAISGKDKIELGYFQGPSQRLVVYLDGSAKWIPNP